MVAPTCFRWFPKAQGPRPSHVHHPCSKAPARDLTTALVAGCAERGVLIIPAGTFGNVIRFLVPLVVTDEQLDEGLDVMQFLLRGRE